MDFNTAVAKILRLEGGYSNDKTDRGGATNYGISTKANPDVDVKSLTQQGAIDLYKTKYWDALGIEKLPDNLKLIAFDSAVNHGVGATRRMLGESKKDPSTFLQLRENMYSKIIAKDPSQEKFKNGWANRLASIAGWKVDVAAEKTQKTPSIAAALGVEEPIVAPATPTAPPQPQEITMQPTRIAQTTLAQAMGAPSDTMATAQSWGSIRQADELSEMVAKNTKASRDALTVAFGGEVKDEQRYPKWLTDMVAQEVELAGNP